MIFKKKSKFFLILILILSFLLRFFKFNQSMQLDADVGMAYLIAERIINEKYLLLVGPITSFGETINVVPPTYYYLITFLYWLFRSDLAVTFILMLTEILAVYFIFHLGKILAGVRTGLFAAFFYATSSIMIGYSHHIWEPYRLPFFVTLSFFLLFLSQIKKSKWVLYLSALFFVVSLMYISTFLILPSFLFLYIFTYKKINGDKKIILGFLPLFLLLIIFYSPVIFYEKQHSFPTLKFLANLTGSESNFISFYSGNYLNSLSTHLKLFLFSIVDTDFYYYLFLTLIPIFFFFLYHRNKILNLNSKLLWLLLA